MEKVDVMIEVRARGSNTAWRTVRCVGIVAASVLDAIILAGRVDPSLETRNAWVPCAGALDPAY